MRGSLGKLRFNSNRHFREMAFKTFESFMHGEEFSQPYTSEKTSKMGFLLVKDDGIYLIPSFEHKGSPRELGYVVYASGYNPNHYDHDELWNKTYEYSADDFGEFIPIEKKMIIQLIYGGDLLVNLSENEIETQTILKPKRIKRPNFVRQVVIRGYLKQLTEKGNLKIESLIS